MFFLWGGEDVVGTEKKEIYILYINIYVNCIVLLYRHWNCCLFIPVPLPTLGYGSSGHTAQLFGTQDCIPSPPALCLETDRCAHVHGSPVTVYPADSLRSFPVGGGYRPVATAIEADKPHNAWPSQGQLGWGLPWREGSSQLRHHSSHAHVFLLSRPPGGPGLVGTPVSY